MRGGTQSHRKAWVMVWGSEWEREWSCMCVSVGGLSGQECVSFCAHFPVTKGIYVPEPLPVVVEVEDHSLWTYKSYTFICTGWLG